MIEEALPRWRTLREVPAVCLHPRNLRQSIIVALVVGTALGLINQAGVILSGQATGATWVRVGLTYLVPFAVANYGILLGSRAR